MARDAIVFFNSLTCNVEDDASGGSEPYIWPVLLLIDNNTLDTPDLVGMARPAAANARVTIRSGMRAGETAEIPPAVRRLQMRLEDGLPLQRLVLVVALLEEDETPGKAVRAGFTAFGDALRAGVASRILQLAFADDADRDFLIEQITEEVEAAVRDAISDALSAFEKARVILGTLNLDDSVGNATLFVDEVGQRAFSLEFREEGGGAVRQDYRLDGTLQVRPVPVETCPDEVAAVKAAEARVAGVEAMIRSTQQELQTAAPGMKPFLVAEIRRLQREELPEAEAALAAARRALSACRARTTGLEAPETGPLLIARAGAPG